MSVSFSTPANSSSGHVPNFISGSHLDKISNSRGEKRSSTTAYLDPVDLSSLSPGTLSKHRIAIMQESLQKLTESLKSPMRNYITIIRKNPPKENSNSASSSASSASSGTSVTSLGLQRFKEAEQLRESHQLQSQLNLILQAQRKAARDLEECKENEPEKAEVAEVAQEEKEEVRFDINLHTPDSKISKRQRVDPPMTIEVREFLQELEQANEVNDSIAQMLPEKCVWGENNLAFKAQMELVFNFLNPIAKKYDKYYDNKYFYRKVAETVNFPLIIFSKLKFIATDRMETEIAKMNGWLNEGKNDSGVCLTRIEVEHYTMLIEKFTADQEKKGEDYSILIWDELRDLYGVKTIPTTEKAKEYRACIDLLSQLHDGFWVPRAPDSEKVMEMELSPGLKAGKRNRVLSLRKVGGIGHLLERLNKDDGAPNNLVPSVPNSLFSSIHAAAASSSSSSAAAASPHLPMLKHYQSNKIK